MDKFSSQGQYLELSNACMATNREMRKRMVALWHCHSGNYSPTHIMLNEEIKLHTTVAHQKLEKIVVKRLKAIRSKEDYANLLLYFYAYFNALEQAISPYINEKVLPDFLKRRKSERLAADIEALGSHIDHLRPVEVPQIKSTASALGAMYVMEGSVMGGPIIVDMLKKVGITQGTEFFSGYGTSNGEMWQRFIECLNQLGVIENGAQESKSAAEQTFSLFEASFGRSH